MLLQKHNLVRNDNPFELPEVMNQIVSYLCYGDFPACARVSKHWHQIFMWRIWKVVDLYKSTPPKSALSKNSYLVTSISIKGVVPPYINGIVFPSLQTLKLCGHYNSKPRLSPYFLERNRTIENLEISYDVLVNDHFLFWKTLSELDKLKKISISNITVPHESMDYFWITLCRLESAVFFYTKFLGLKSPLTTPHKLKYLKIFYPSNTTEQPQFIDRCTSLEHLDISARIQSIYLAERFRQSTWPNLTKLELDHIPLVDIELQWILNSLTQPTILSLKLSTWGSESFNALSQHFETLELFRSEDPSFTSKMVNTVMCSCPRLELLEVHVINGVDISSNSTMDSGGNPSKRWICTRLRSLTMLFDVQGLDSQLPFLQQLSCLTNLSHLAMMHFTNRFPCLNFSLDAGLDILKTLKNLRVLTIYGKNNEMDDAEIEWILKNWKNLGRINGKLNPSIEKHNQLRKKLQSYGIGTTSMFIV